MEDKQSLEEEIYKKLLEAEEYVYGTKNFSTEQVIQAMRDIIKS